MKITFGMNIVFLAVVTVILWSLANTVLVQPVSLICGWLGLFSLILAVVNGVMAYYEE